ncbi:tetratricopeptide repeat-containing sensor histidine kinase [Niabella aurantiaca]|uniref:tetratricopeptide repeat-containing sensor histidine kinase n=1 Tax=Niabella aurantiaca TaxID=379900 RepID=UPI000365AFA9|nr:tetratricopeptide repeat-containing sensor histidine kinase [Niabella aurantiaca]
MGKRSFLLPLLLAAFCFLRCDRSRKTIPIITTNDYKKGESFYKTKSDSAFYYFNRAAVNSPDSIQIAMAYTYMAIIQSNAGDYFGSQENLLRSLRYLNEQKEKDRYCLLSNYNELGRTSSNLKNYDAAIGYYDQALRLIKDDNTRIIALSNKAVTYQKKQQYAAAISIYRSIIDDTKEDKKRYARILSNMANAKWLQDPSYNAAPELLTALQIHKNEKNEWGLNASYAHLSDYYSRFHPDSALIYAGNMYAVAQRLGSPDDEVEALQKLIALSPADAAKKYFARYLYLNDSLQTGRNNAKNQFALIRYDVEKNKMRILSLQKENAEKRFRILLQRAALLGTILLAAVALFWYRRQKQRAIREQRLKTSQKVHDVVANGLYRIMTDIENQKTIEKELLLDKMEILYEHSRNISYEQPESVTQDFQKSVIGLLESFATETTSVSIVGNDRETWDKVPRQVKKELDHILQELMTNMKKHSSAENVVLRFELQAGRLIVQYTDDGIGMAPGSTYGNGLTNTENRIQHVGGHLIFDKKTSKGVKIQLYIPIA